MTILYFRLQNGDPLPVLDGFSPYKAVVVIEDIVDFEWQAAASRWLADSGCLFMMAWGKDCSSWDDSVDYANMDQFASGEIPDDKFILTSWHGDEPLQQVVWFSKFAAIHSTIELENVLFLHIGSADRQSEFEDLYRNANSDC